MMTTISDPFHKIATNGWLHPSPAVNRKLLAIGQRYARDHERARGGSNERLADYNAARDVDIPAVADTNQRPYFEASKVLEDFADARVHKLLEDIVIHGRPVVDAGREYSDRQHEKQAVATAITALGIGLLILRQHYEAIA